MQILRPCLRPFSFEYLCMQNRFVVTIYTSDPFHFQNVDRAQVMNWRMLSARAISVSNFKKLFTKPISMSTVKNTLTATRFNSIYTCGWLLDNIF